MKNVIQLTVIVLAAMAAGYGQQAEHPGMTLYSQGKYGDAIDSLTLAVKSKEDRNDAEIWNVLGLAYLKTQKYKDSRKAFDKAVKLAPASAVFRANLAYAYLLVGDTRKAKSEAGKAIERDPRNLDAHLFRGIAYLRENDLDKSQADVDNMLQIDPAFVDAYAVGADIQIQRLGSALSVTGGIEGMKANADFLAKAVELLTTGVDRCGECPKKTSLSDRLENTKALYDYAVKERPVVPGPPDPNVTPLKIISKPRARYTDAARTADVQGIVRVAVLMGANGRVLYVLPLKTLGHGLDQQAVSAAQQIRFEPKLVNGKPVSSVVLIEYSFLY